MVYKTGELVNRLVAIAREARKKKNDSLAEDCDTLREQIKRDPLGESHDSYTERVRCLADSHQKQHERTPNQEPRTKNQEPVTNSNKPAGKPASSPVGIKNFLDACKESGEAQVKPDDPIMEYAEKAGIPQNFLRLCWYEFVERNLENGKRQKDWRATFRNCVRSNWYQLWYIDGAEYLLTTKGKQAELKHGAKNGKH
jgi:hypothetical protein